MFLLLKNISQANFTLTILLLCINFGCNAPHDNPLDPENPNNKLVLLDGYVKTMSLPHTPIVNAKVVFEKQNLITTTNNDGYFKFENIRSDDGWVKFEKDGFKFDSLFISWLGQKKISLETYLNELPVLQTSSFYSVIINRYSIGPLAYIVLNESISDKDNDVDSVFVSNSTLNFKKPLDYNVTKKFYETTLSPTEMNVGDIEMIVGYDFKILVKDIYNDLIEVGSEHITRIITSEVLFESPKDLEVVSSTPTLKWKRFAPGFSFTYTAEVYTNEIDPQLVWQEDNISSDDISITVNTALPAGNYFWVIWCIDDFLNRTRSKPASFIVE